jgi:hypothetical protein
MVFVQGVRFSLTLAAYQCNTWRCIATLALARYVKLAALSSDIEKGHMRNSQCC